MALAARIPLALISLATVVTLASAVAAQPASQTVVPFLGMQGQNHYAEYLERRSPKAMAISPSGVFGSSSSGASAADAQARALDNCQKNAPLKCELFAADGAVVWRGPTTPAAQVEWANAELRRARLAAPAFADEDRDGGTAPPSTLRTGNLSAPTPNALPQGTTIATGELLRLMTGSHPPVLIDVQYRRGYLAPTIPGALWIDGAGGGDWTVQETAKLPARLFRDAMQRLAPDKTSPVVFFCNGPKCWLSYNAALRAIALGYRQVVWYRGGVTAWVAAGLPLAHRALDAEIATAEPEDASVLATRIPDPPGASNQAGQLRVAPKDWRVLLLAGDDSVRNFDRAVQRYAAALKSAGVDAGAIRALSPLANSDDRKPTEERIEAALTSLAPGPGQACLAIMTSHGSQRGFKLSVGGAERTLSPERLGQILDRTCGDRPTVVVVSACYSGVFIDSRIQADHRIVLTAAHRTRQSFGCSSDFDVPIYDKCALQNFSGNRHFHDWARRIEACVAEREDKERIRRPSVPQAFFGKRVEHLAFLAE
jgi:PQQ-dependent catabolism-associated CXXCW motif protein